MAQLLAGVAWKKVWSIVFGVFGLLLLALGLWLASLPWHGYGARPITHYTNLILGPMLLIIAVRSYGRAVFKLTEEGLEYYNLLGMRMKIIPMRELEVESEPSGRKKLFHVRASGRRRLLMTTSNMLADSAMLGAMISQVETRRGAAA